MLHCVGTTTQINRMVKYPASSCNVKLMWDEVDSAVLQAVDKLLLLVYHVWLK